MLLISPPFLNSLETSRLVSRTYSPFAILDCKDKFTYMGKKSVVNELESINQIQKDYSLRKFVHVMVVREY